MRFHWLEQLLQDLTRSRGKSLHRPSTPRSCSNGLRAKDKTPWLGSETCLARHHEAGTVWIMRLMADIWTLNEQRSCPLVALGLAFTNVIHRQSKKRNTQAPIKERKESQRWNRRLCVMVPSGASIHLPASIGLEMSHIKNKDGIKIIPVKAIQPNLTAMRVCEDALRCKMILVLGGEGRRGLGEVQTWIPPLRMCSTYRQEPAGCSPNLLLFQFYLRASPRDLAFSVHTRNTALSPIEERRFNYVVCCVKPVPTFLRAHSVTATLDNSLVILARTKPSSLPRTLASAN